MPSFLLTWNFCPPWKIQLKFISFIRIPYLIITFSANSTFSLAHLPTPPTVLLVCTVLINYLSYICQVCLYTWTPENWNATDVSPCWLGSSATSNCTFYQKPPSQDGFHCLGGTRESSFSLGNATSSICENMQIQTNKKPLLKSTSTVTPC